MSVVKSPMGLMMGFMVLVMFVMPKLMENMGKVLLFTNCMASRNCTRLVVDLAHRFDFLNAYCHLRGL